MTRAVVLFDIDGTLLVTGGASSRCIRRAAASVLGRSVNHAQIILGTLDAEIFAQLAGEKVGNEPLQRYREAYAAELQRELAACAADVKALPGGRELVEVLSSRPDVCVGILSGNWREIGEMKLRAAGYNLSGFQIRVSGDDGARRPELVLAALKQVSLNTGTPCSAADIILVGDTPRDIACAREAGCRVASVATGAYSLSELQASSPDAAMVDLAHAQSLMALIAGRQ